ncbi:AAA family ATPase [Phormidium willei BDU 130791]|nr:AAA family ATPase [Phormidium willei BDU 130791]
MEIQEALQWTDRLLLKTTGKHLDTLQRAILEGAWQGKGYKEIAKEYHCTNDHVRKSASDLWKLLSELLEEDVKKKNVRSLIENRIFSYYEESVHIGDNINNVCNDLYNEPKISTNPSTSNSESDTTPRHNLSQAPEYDRLHTRHDELTTLKKWIFEEHSRIITLTGLSGIGKTALARQLVEHIKDHFTHILWCNHRKFPNLETLKNHICQFFAATSTPNTSLLDHLRLHRCLLILDNLQETLTPGEFVGTYRRDYQGYGQLLRELGTCSHQSCILLLSWEHPLEIAALESETRYCKTLPVQGFPQLASQILRDRQLKDPKTWPKLTQLYNNNPLWLNLTASTILDLFNGSVEQFLSYPTLFLGDLETVLTLHYQRLGNAEKTLLHWLANQDSPANLNPKPANLLSDREFLKAIQSLKRRSLLEPSSQCNLQLSLQPVIRQYIRNLAESSP